MDTFKKSAEVTTLVKTDESLKIEAKGSKDFSEIDNCCPHNEHFDFEYVKGDIKDDLERISCDIPKEEFFIKYVKRQQPVILLNCSSEWRAQRYWTAENLFKRGNGEMTWTSDYVDGSKPFLGPSNVGTKYSGNFLQSVIDNNGTVRVFDEIGRREEWRRRRQGDTSENKKMELFDDYSQPKPIPEDMYAAAGIHTDYQWVIVTQRNTGTGLHTDPDYTMAWNTLLSGRKWWVLLPPELPDQPFKCNIRCRN